jgi:hypothetical protein
MVSKEALLTEAREPCFLGRHAKAEGLAERYGPEVIDLLLELLQEESEHQTRDMILRWIGFLRDPRAVKPLIKMAEEYPLGPEPANQDFEVIQRILSTLGMIGSEDAVKYLKPLIAEEYWERRGIRTDQARQCLQEFALSSFAGSGTKEALDTLKSGEEIPKDFTHAIPGFIKSCERAMAYREHRPYVDPDADPRIQRTE